jgi:uncharacterized protein (TIGR00369 family)
MSDSAARSVLDVEQLQAMMLRAPYHRWLGIVVNSVSLDAIEVRATWREEWIANADTRHTHGGVLAALIDLTADFVLATRLGRAVPTIDMRVDYHRMARPGDLIVRGSVVKAGRQISVSEARVLDLDGMLIASGRGTYLTAAAQSG